MVGDATSRLLTSSAFDRIVTTSTPAESGVVAVGDDDLRGLACLHLHRRCDHAGMPDPRRHPGVLPPKGGMCAACSCLTELARGLPILGDGPASNAPHGDLGHDGEARNRVEPNAHIRYDEFVDRNPFGDQLGRIRGEDLVAAP
jgi:hypothetical protein